MYFCSAGASELAITRWTTSTVFRFTIPARSKNAYCFSFATLPGLAPAISFHSDQDAFLKWNSGILLSPDASFFCPAVNQLVKVSAGMIGPDQVSTPCYFDDWFAPLFNMVTVGGAGVTQPTTFTFRLSGAPRGSFWLFVPSMPTVSSSLSPVEPGDSCKYAWLYGDYSRCSKECDGGVAVRTASCRCGMSTLDPPFAERCPANPVLNKTCNAWPCDGTRVFCVCFVVELLGDRVWVCVRSVHDLRRNVLSPRHVPKPGPVRVQMLL
jgi:hypothetical protein